HPGRSKANPAAKGSFDEKRSVIQVAELKYINNEIVCDRDEPIAGNKKGVRIL
ncbi:MAG: glycosyl hydrolase, partial [Chitinophagaceae bacterium]|nr:glycosyl hydrolase [Chitinophagaceae bacterium]